MEGNAFTDFVTAFRKAVFGYTEEEAKKLNEDAKKVEEKVKKEKETGRSNPIYDITDTALIKAGIDPAKTEMFLGLFVFLVLIMMFKR
jgi:predicted S18 family serine protease